MTYIPCSWAKFNSRLRYDISVLLAVEYWSKLLLPEDKFTLNSKTSRITCISLLKFKLVEDWKYLHNFYGHLIKLSYYLKNIKAVNSKFKIIVTAIILILLIILLKDNDIFFFCEKTSMLNKNLYINFKNMYNNLHGYLRIFTN